MHSIARFLSLVLAVTAVASVCGCKKESGAEGGSDPLPYPVEREITDAKGRKLDVVILGRSESEVFFKRKGDGKRFDFPITDLSLADRVAVNKLPVHAVPKSDPAAEREAQRKDSFVEFRKESIAKLERRIRDLEADKRKADNRGDSTRSRAFMREIDRLKREIKDLELEIEGAK